jgi:DNA-binding MurR/RpiR family transcriptional regulator
LQKRRSRARLKRALQVEARILQSIDGLTPTETRVARAILARYPASAIRSSGAIAKAAGTSPASVVRFVAKLGFPALHDFHEAVRAELDPPRRSPFDEVAAEADGDGLVESIVRSETANVTDTLRRLRPDVLAAVRDLLLGSSVVASFGGRFSQSLAMYLVAHLQLLRPRASLLTTADVAEHLAHLGRGACLVVFDFRRYHPEAEAAAAYMKARRGRVVCVTDPYLSPASHHADHTLVAEIEGPRLLDSYAAVVALLDTIVSAAVSVDPERARRRVERVEEARQLMGSPPLGIIRGPARDDDGGAR